MSAWRRVVACLGIVVAGLALSGCHVQGMVELVSTKRANLDLMVSQAGIDCSETAGSIMMEPAAAVGGLPTCHLTGFVDLSEGLGLERFAIIEAGDYWVLDMADQSDRSSWPTGEVTLHFPGDVVTTTQGRVAGNVVTLANLSDVKSTFTVVALNRPGPPSWVIGTAAGVAGGLLFALAMLGVARLVRRLRLKFGAREPIALTDPAARGTAESDQLGSEEHDGDPNPVWQAAPREEPVAPEPVDHSWFAAPPSTSVPPQPAPDAAAPREPHDHSIWAPPEL
jgi:hypothetical protein